jgi:hypothetical protein
MATFCTSRPRTWTPTDTSTAHSRRLARVQSPRKTTARQDARRNKFRQTQSAAPFGQARPASARAKRCAHARHLREVRDARAKRVARNLAAAEAAFDPRDKFVMPRFARTPSRLVNRGDEVRDERLAAYNARRDAQIARAKAKTLSQTRARSASRNGCVGSRNGEAAARFARESPLRSGVQAWSSPSIVGPMVTELRRTSTSPKKSADDATAAKKERAKVMTMKKKKKKKTRGTAAAASGLPFWFKGQADAWELLNAPLQK